MGGRQRPMTGSHARLSPSTAGASAPDGEGNPGSLASYGIHDCRRKIGSSLRNYPAWFCRPDLFFMNVRIVTMRPYQVSLRSISFVALSAKKPATGIQSAAGLVRTNTGPLGLNLDSQSRVNAKLRLSARFSERSAGPSGTQIHPMGRRTRLQPTQPPVAAGHPH
jgi:hypothetical protein